MDKQIEAFLFFLKTQKQLSKNTLKAYRKDLEYLKECSPRKKIAEIGSNDIRGHIARMSSFRLTGKSIGRRFQMSLMNQENYMLQILQLKAVNQI